jgi:hypothetical protein
MAAVHRAADVRRSHPGLPCYELSEVVQASNVCGLGETAPYPVLSKLSCFGDEYEEKLRAAEARAEVTPVWLRDRASQSNALTQDSGGDARRGGDWSRLPLAVVPAGCWDPVPGRGSPADPRLRGLPTTARLRLSQP